LLRMAFPHPEATRTPAAPLNAIVLRTRPIQLAEAPPVTSTPSDRLPSGDTPSTAVPIRVDCSKLPPDAAPVISEPSAVPAMTFPDEGDRSPIRFPELFSRRIPGPVFPRASVPPPSVPIRLPKTWLLFPALRVCVVKVSDQEFRVPMSPPALSEM